MYRTRIYIAADWSGDFDAVEQLHKWNDSDYWSLSFTDAHDLKQANDGSLKCSIKSSLAERLNASKTFVLIVGNNTKSLRNGSCQYCNSYNSWTKHCARGHYVDMRSYLEFECEKAVNDGIRIVVLYKAAMVNRNKCIASVQNIGTHARMYCRKDERLYWDYNSVKEAINPSL